MSGSSLVMEQYDRIEKALVASNGVMTDEVMELVREVDLVAGIKADGLVALMKTAEDEAQRWKREAAEYTALQRAAEARAESIKAALKQRMEAEQLDKIEGPRYGVSLCDSPVSIKWPGKPDELPMYMQRMKVELDTALARSLYNAGKLPSGFTVERGKHLRIM